MQLEKHGLKLITPEVAVTALSPDGRALVLYHDAKGRAGDRQVLAERRGQYAALQASLEKIGSVIGDALTLTPPNIDDPSAAISGAC